MRGIDSSANPYTPACASRSTPAVSVSGWRNAISAWPAWSRETSSALGAATFAISSAPQGSPIVAPASRYAASGKAAASPAPASTTTSMPSPRRPTVSGTRATRCSPPAVSWGTPTRMRARRYRMRMSPRIRILPRTRGDLSVLVLPANQRAGYEPAQCAGLVDGPERYDVPTRRPEAQGGGPVPRERAARQAAHDREAAPVRQRPRLVVALDDRELAEAVVADPEACEHARTDAPQRHEPDARRPVAGDGCRDGCRGRVRRHEVRRARRGRRLAARRVCRHERPHAVARVDPAHAV